VERASLEKIAQICAALVKPSIGSVVTHGNIV